MPYIEKSGRKKWQPKQKPFEQAKRVSGVYNTSRWRKISLQFRRLNPLCKLCEDKGIIKSSVITDHVNGFKDASDPAAWDWNNLQALCKECSDKKSGREARKKNINNSILDDYE